MNPLVRRLSSTPYEKVWGSPLTEPWYANGERREIGEVWFSASEAVPLLIKLLFTSQKLSVQVHPDDAYAKEHEDSRGKTEMWHVLRADPGAEVAVGLRERVSPERLREASLTGDIMDLLNWLPARAGDTFYVPAGTIHAIGAGLVLCEIQQISDVTYRLYDYFRGRPLHVDDALAVSYLEPREAALADCEYFRTERVSVRGGLTCPAPARNTVYIAVHGHGVIGGQPFSTGEAWELTAGACGVRIESSDAEFVVTSEP